jgi:hypothetical protein
MTAGVHWWGGLKLVLAALGVIALGTAIKTFMSWSPRTSGGNALFTIGVAIVGALLFGKLLPKGGAAAVTTAGLVIGGYEWLKPQADQLGASVGSSIRGGGFMSSTPTGAQPTGATSYPMAGSTIVGAVPSVTPTVQPTVQPQGITVIQQAAKPASTTSQIISGISGIASSFFGAGGGFGSLVGGSKGIQDVDYSLGSGADRYSRLLNLTAV